MSFWRLPLKISIYKIVIRFCKFLIVLFAYLGRCSKCPPPACTQALRHWHDPLFQSRGFDAWSFTCHLVFIDPGVKIIGAYYRNVLLAQHLLSVISSNACWMCGRNEIRINEDQMWTTKRRSRNELPKRLAEIRNRTQQSLQTVVC